MPEAAQQPTSTLPAAKPGYCGAASWPLTCIFVDPPPFFWLRIRPFVAFRRLEVLSGGHNARTGGREVILLTPAGAASAELLIRWDVQVFLSPKQQQAHELQAKQWKAWCVHWPTGRLNVSEQPEVTGVEVPLWADSGVIFLDCVWTKWPSLTRLPNSPHCCCQLPLQSISIITAWLSLTARQDRFIFIF